MSVVKEDERGELSVVKKEKKKKKREKMETRRSLAILFNNTFFPLCSKIQFMKHDELKISAGIRIVMKRSITERSILIVGKRTRYTNQHNLRKNLNEILYTGCTNYTKVYILLFATLNAFSKKKINGKKYLQNIQGRRSIA